MGERVNDVIKRLENHKEISLSCCSLVMELLAETKSFELAHYFAREVLSTFRNNFDLKYVVEKIMGSMSKLSEKYPNFTEPEIITNLVLSSIADCLRSASSDINIDHD